MDDKQKPKILVPASENADVSRAVRKWLNTYPNKPLSKLDFEWLGKSSGLCISTIQAAYKTKQFIDGTYQAQYQFKIIYRTTATDADERITADEVLDKYGEWAEQNSGSLTIADGISVKKVKRDTAAALFARYEGDVEDHQILLTLLYEVI